jgi:GTPase SAR1 family protein
MEQFNEILEKLKQDINQEDLDRFINRPPSNRGGPRHSDNDVRLITIDYLKNLNISDSN